MKKFRSAVFIFVITLIVGCGGGGGDDSSSGGGTGTVMTEGLNDISNGAVAVGDLSKVALECINVNNGAVDLSTPQVTMVTNVCSFEVNILDLKQSSTGVFSISPNSTVSLNEFFVDTGVCIAPSAPVDQGNSTFSCT